MTNWTSPPPPLPIQTPLPLLLRARSSTTLASTCTTPPTWSSDTVNSPHSFVLTLVTDDRAELKPVGAPHWNPVFLDNISHGQLQALSSIPANSLTLVPHDHKRSDSSSSAASAYVRSPLAIMEGKGIIRHYGNQHLDVMQMHSDWFSSSSVNRFEWQVVPHFLSGKLAKHTPEKYMELRNRIVNISILKF
ncbi:hypothetical protein AAC387_Pa04g2532 [Persea americana]